MQLDHADSPLLMLGLAGIYARAYQMDMTLAFLGGTVASLCGKTLFATGNHFPSPGNMVINRGKSGSALTLVQPQTGSLTTNDQTWQKVTRLAARMYVPETQMSRAKGAGAGLTDND